MELRNTLWGRANIMDGGVVPPNDYSITEVGGRVYKRGATSISEGIFNRSWVPFPHHQNISELPIFINLT